MSILIKGMKMPENCGECIWIQRGYPDWCDLPMGKDLYNDKKRPDWCPLVEVPKPQNRPATWGDVYNSLKVLEALLETIDAEEGEPDD